MLHVPTLSQADGAVCDVFARAHVTIARVEMCEAGEKGSSIVLEKNTQIFSGEGQSCSPYYS